MCVCVCVLYIGGGQDKLYQCLISQTTSKRNNRERECLLLGIYTLHCTVSYLTTTHTHTHTFTQHSIVLYINTYSFFRFCGTRDYCWIHHGRTLSISLEPGADPAKEVNKMCRSHGKRGANTDRIFKKGVWLSIYINVCTYTVRHIVIIVHRPYYTVHVHNILMYIPYLLL